MVDRWLLGLDKLLQTVNMGCCQGWLVASWAETVAVAACPDGSLCGRCRKRSAGLCAAQMGCEGQMGGWTWLAGNIALPGVEVMLNGLGRGVWMALEFVRWLDSAKLATDNHMCGKLLGCQFSSCGKES